MSGPVPKRSEERRRRNKGDVPLVSAPGEATSQPPVEDGWHPLARDWYVSLARSGQAAFYQASDWETARVWAEVLSRELLKGRMSAPMIAAWAGAAGELLTTEGARRRARVELDRHRVDEDEAAAVTALDSYRAALGA